MRPSPESIQRIVRMALEEDAPWSDLTTEALVDSEAHIEARLTAREDGVLCGEDLFTAAMQQRSNAKVEFAMHDADAFHARDVLARISGPARAVLTAERVALNFVQRLSGIATLTSKYVAAVAGTRARIVDTRKTTPGLRLFERYAVRCGGGANHRFCLSDAVMVKDNHLAVAATGGDVTASLRAMKQQLGHTVHIEVEVDRLDQIEAVLAAGIDTIMLDNFSPHDLKSGVLQVAGRALVEASGGITLDRAAEIAATGVDLISVGELTHSIRSLDLGLDF